MALADYADIQISYEAQTVSRAGFGTLLFITDDASQTAGTVSPLLASLQEVVDAGYVVGTEPHKFATAAFAQGQGFRRLKFYHRDTTPDAESFAQAVGNAEALDSDFYAVAIESREAADIEAVANDIEARQKLFIAVTDDVGVPDAQVDTDVASVLLGQNLSRTGLLLKADAFTEYPEAAWFGEMLPRDPGTANWAYKTLNGQTTDSFTAAERTALRAKRCNQYESVAGNSITFGGYTSEPGIYLDIVRGVDWLQTRMQEDYIAVQTANDRIPYVGGGEIIESQVVRRRLDIAVDRGVIADDYTVFVPRWQDQDPVDRAARHYPGITFAATIVSSVNTVQVRGTVRP